MRVELNGGRYPFDKTSGQQQKAIIEFICDANRTGLEGGEADTRDKIENEERQKRNFLRAEDGEKKGDEKKGDEKDGKDGEGEPEPEEPSLTLLSYKLEGEGDRRVEVLRLNWRTKYACEGETGHKPSGSKSSHWGFFTWFLIV